MDVINIEWVPKGENGDLPHVAVNAANGMIVGEVIDGGDRIVYESHMPKSKGEQWVFVSEEKAKKWVEQRYSGQSSEKPAAPAKAPR